MSVLRVCVTVFIWGWWAAWTLSVFMRSFGRQPAEWCVTIKHELRPLIPVAVLADYLLSTETPMTFRLMAVGGWMLAWWASGLDDDDRWKRRRRRLAQRVQQLGARLVVVPS